MHIQYLVKRPIFLKLHLFLIFLKFISHADVHTRPNHTKRTRSLWPIVSNSWTFFNLSYLGLKIHIYVSLKWTWGFFCFDIYVTLTLYGRYLDIYVIFIRHFIELCGRWAVFVLFRGEFWSVKFVKTSTLFQALFQCFGLSQVRPLCFWGFGVPKQRAWT